MTCSQAGLTYDDKSDFSQVVFGVLADLLRERFAADPGVYEKDVVDGEPFSCALFTVAEPFASPFLLCRPPYRLLVLQSHMPPPSPLLVVVTAPARLERRKAGPNSRAVSRSTCTASSTRIGAAGFSENLALLSRRSARTRWTCASTRIRRCAAVRGKRHARKL